MKLFMLSYLMMAYNIMALFKHQVLNSTMQLKTLRAYCFAIGSWITNHANEEVLNIALPQKRRAWMNFLDVKTILNNNTKVK